MKVFGSGSPLPVALLPSYSIVRSQLSWKTQNRISGHSLHPKFIFYIEMSDILTIRSGIITKLILHNAAENWYWLGSCLMLRLAPPAPVIRSAHLSFIERPSIYFHRISFRASENITSPRNPASSSRMDLCYIEIRQKNMDCNQIWFRSQFMSQFWVALWEDILMYLTWPLSILNSINIAQQYSIIQFYANTYCILLENVVMSVAVIGEWKWNRTAASRWIL